MKAHAAAVREMAVDPMTTLQALAGNLDGRFEAWTYELTQAELAAHVDRYRYQRTGKLYNHRNVSNSR
jgi:hypothetical protein